MNEHVAPVVYYLGVHFLFASLVWFAAWVLTSVPLGSATTKYWIWVATALNFMLPAGVIVDKMWASHLSWARPLSIIGDVGVRVAQNRPALVALCMVWLLGAALMSIRLGLRLRADRRYGHVSSGPSALEAAPRALAHLISQPGVNRDVIGVGGAGWLGVDNSVKAAIRHSAEVRSLVLLSGETLKPELQFLRQASQLPGLFVVADDDEYPPTVEAMELLYVTSSNPGKRFVHYSAPAEAPWLWYETADAARVPARGGHGTDLFKAHPELPGIIVNWLVTTLIKTPGHAPADTLASAPILDQIRMPGGVARVRQQLQEAR